MSVEVFRRNSMSSGFVENPIENPRLWFIRFGVIFPYLFLFVVCFKVCSGALVQIESNLEPLLCFLDALTSVI